MRISPLTKQLFTVDEVAGRLNLHAKTVRRFIRDGRLPAKRIGKEYRITRSALDEFAGTAATEPSDAAIPRARQVLVSSIVDVDAISPEDSQRITTLIMAGLELPPRRAGLPACRQPLRRRPRPAASHDHRESEPDVRFGWHDRGAGRTDGRLNA
jgi:excisionase family DNA binding protein